MTILENIHNEVKYSIELSEVTGMYSIRIGNTSLQGRPFETMNQALTEATKHINLTYVKTSFKDIMKQCCTKYTSY